MKKADEKMTSSVAVVNVQKIYQDSVVAEQGREHLEKVKFNLRKGAEAVEDVYGVKGSHPSGQALSEGLQRLEVQYKAEEVAVNQVVAQVLTKTAEAWAESHPDYVVVPNTTVLATGKNTDITKELLKEMEKVTPTFGTLPTVTVTPPKANEVKGNKAKVEGSSEKKGTATKKAEKVDKAQVH